jgi:hypothetical protein
MNKGRTTADFNNYTGGWFIDDSVTTRLIYTTGGWEQWREATVSSELRPGGPLKSTPHVPVNVVPRGFHGMDLYGVAAEPAAREVMSEEVAQIAKWVEEYYQH